MRDGKFILLLLKDRQGVPRQLLRGRLRKEPELLERRCVLSASPIEFGAVYTEQDLGSDAHPDSIELTFVGGAEATQLSRVEIDGDKFDAGFSLADIIFDTSPSGLGADLSYDGEITQSDPGITTQIVVEDGNSKVVLLLEGFYAGDKLTLSIDADEVQGYDPEQNDLSVINEDLDPIASGAEFQGSLITAYFTAPRFHDADATAEFRNRYDDLLATTSLDLPRDDAGGIRDRTAGAVGGLVQSPLPIGISGRVYEDRNTNLQQDAIDPGIKDVPLELFVEGGNDYISTGFTTITDVDGDYEFPKSLGLLPGRYQVRESQPAGYFSVGANVGHVDGVPVGRAVNPDVLSEIEIADGDAWAREYNFAEARTASLSGRVHLGTPDGDCFSDNVTHAPVEGARVTLFDQDGQLVAETLTDAEGRYQFLDLAPGQYSVVEITPDQLVDGGSQAGTVDGETRGSADGDRISQIELLSGDDGFNYEFCEFPPARLSGTVYHDRDNDGLREVGEEGIAGALLSLLDEEGTLVETTETDEEGRYEFVGLRTGNYRVVELQPVGWLDGRDRAGSVSGLIVGEAHNPGDEISDITLLWGDEGIDYDFGELRPGSLQGRVHLSTVDGDCWNIDDELIEPVAGAVVQLFDANGQVLEETVTDGEGVYSFGDLAPGEYGIRELTPPGLIDGGAQAGEIDGRSVGLVANGGEIRSIHLQSQQVGINYDFCEHQPSVLSGYVFADDDNDGARELGESPIADVVIQLFDPEGNLVAETQTDASGRYEFARLPPGNYSIRQLQPAGWLDGLDAAGTVDGEARGQALNPGDAIIDVSLGWGETGVEYNFGELQPATIAGIVRSSAVEDCWNDPHALPVSAVRIWLFNADSELVAETVTDADGRYHFADLTPGEYTVVQEQPLTVFDGAHRAGSVGGDSSVPNEISRVDLSAGDDAVRYDFCEVPAAQISGYVFVDGEPIPLQSGEILPENVASLRSGILTDDDVRLAGVRLELRNGIRGEPVDASLALPGVYPDGPISVVTGQDGYYEFVGIPKGNYAVYQLHPDQYIDGIDTPGTASGIAVNPREEGADSIELETVVATLVEPPRNDAIVRIGVPAGVHSQFNNFSEVSTREIRIDFPQDPPPTRPLSPLPGTPNRPNPLGPFRDLGPAPLQGIEFTADGSSSAVGNAWHLSIIDGGQPRVATVEPSGPRLAAAVAWQPRDLGHGSWRVPNAAGASETFWFGVDGAIPISGDFNGDGISEVGVFLDGHWFIDLNANGHWDGSDLWAKLGHAEDLPVTGDWDGDGKDDIGIFGKAWPGDPEAIRHEPGLPDMDNVPSGERKNMPPDDEVATQGRRVMQLTSRGTMRADVIDHVFVYGTTGDTAVAGDWNGDGIDTVGVFRFGNWKLDVDGNGRFTSQDENHTFGAKGDIPLVGDFNGDGIDDLAIVRNGRVYIDANGNRQLDHDDLVMEVGQHGVPVAGKWIGDAVDQIAWYQAGKPTAIVVASRADTE